MDELTTSAPEGCRTIPVDAIKIGDVIYVCAWMVSRLTKQKSCGNGDKIFLPNVLTLTSFPRYKSTDVWHTGTSPDSMTIEIKVYELDTLEEGIVTYWANWDEMWVL